MWSSLRQCQWQWAVSFCTYPTSEGVFILLALVALFAVCCLTLAARLQWTAPEVRAGSEAAGRVVSTASDVYMVGGLAYELLTCGVPPFHWLSRNAQLLIERLTSADSVEIPGIDMEVPSLLHKNVLEAAVVDRKPIPWCVQADATPGSGGRLEEVKGLMASCLALGPEERPTLPNLHQRLSVLLATEVAEARAIGTAGAPVSSAWHAHVVAHAGILGSSLCSPTLYG